MANLVLAITKRNRVGRSESSELLTVSQTAAFLKVHSNTVRRWADLGILKTQRVGLRKDRKFSRSDLDAFKQT